ncbi:hypothetical protein BSKO_03091 [Bryopsis sp. KO-2023]|nr:hypothetical protein BSKO_03091 [Bryopsis sp. KO-2023]
MSSQYWEKYPPTLEALAKGMGGNLSDGPCMCSRCTCHGPSEMEKFEIRVKEIVTWLVGKRNIKKVRESETEKAKELLCNKVSIAGQLCQAAELGGVAKMNTELDNLECTEETKFDIATELMNVASQHGKLDAVKSLVEEWGADITGESVVGGNAFTCAAGSGHIQIVKYLLSREPSSLNTPCLDGFTPLMFASFWSRLGVLAMLQSRGADLTMEDKYGRSALSYAALYGNVDAVNSLCEAGSDIYQEDRDGKTPLELARSYNRCTHVVGALTRWQKTANLRQKLKERSSKKDLWGSVKSSEGEVDRRIADQHMEELLKEIEEEEIQRSQRKERKSQKKKKREATRSTVGSSGGSICDNDDIGSSLDDPVDENTGSMGHHRSARQEIPGKGGGSCAKVDKGEANSVEKQVSAQNDPPKASTKKAHRDDPGFLREYWGFILQEAAKCTDAEKQLEYLECIPKIMGECQDVGISVKYGKKVLGRLERVAAGREAIHRAIELGDPTEISEALSNAKGLRDMIDPRLWSQAENVAREVLTSQLDFSRQKMAQIQLDQSHGFDRPPEPHQQYSSYCADPDGGYAFINNNEHHPPAYNEMLYSVDPAQGQLAQSWHDGLNLSSSLDSYVQPGWVEPPPAEHHHHHQRAPSPPKMEEGLEKDLECMVCMAAQKSACCIPCGHISMCYQCSLEVQGKTGICPLCRSEIEFVMPIQ